MLSCFVVDKNIPLRGHRDDAKSDSMNKGNFLALLDLMAKRDPILQKHLENAKKNATGTSKTVQNEIIQIIGEHIRSALSAPLQDEKAVYSIIADEVTDKFSNQEILSLCLRFVDKNDIKEIFFDFVSLERTTGVAIANAIVSSLRSNGIDINKIRGQGYDGASAMSSEKAGVHGQIKSLVPTALYIHCSSHVLNLSIASSCKMPIVRNMVDVINEIFLFFDLSPKRQRMFERVLEVKGSQSRKKKLKGLCKTRWVERHTCFDTFQELYAHIGTTLNCILDPGAYPEVYKKPDTVPQTADDQEEREDTYENWKWDRETRVKAQGLLSSMKTSSNIVAFQVVRNTLEVIRPLATKLQKQDQDVYHAYQMVDDVRQRLEEIRTNVETEFSGWYEASQTMAEEVDSEAVLKSITKGMSAFLSWTTQSRKSRLVLGLKTE